MKAKADALASMARSMSHCAPSYSLTRAPIASGRAGRQLPDPLLAFVCRGATRGAPVIESEPRVPNAYKSLSR